MPDDRSAALDPIDLPEWERRGELRRADDRSLRERCTALARELGAALAVLVAVAGIFGGMAAILGVKLQGPPQAIAAISTRVDSLDHRVGRLEAGAQQTHEQLRDITGDVRFLSYQLCITTRSHDAVAQDRCQAIQQSFRGSP